MEGSCFSLHLHVGHPDRRIENLMHCVHKWKRESWYLMHFLIKNYKIGGFFFGQFSFISFIQALPLFSSLVQFQQMPSFVTISVIRTMKSWKDFRFNKISKLYLNYSPRKNEKLVKPKTHSFFTSIEEGGHSTVKS